MWDEIGALQWGFMYAFGRFGVGRAGSSGEKECSGLKSFHDGRSARLRIRMESRMLEIGGPIIQGELKARAIVDFLSFALVRMLDLSS